MPMTAKPTPRPAPVVGAAAPVLPAAVALAEREGVADPVMPVVAARELSEAEAEAEADAEDAEADADAEAEADADALPLGQVGLTFKVTPTPPQRAWAKVMVAGPRIRL